MGVAEARDHAALWAGRKRFKPRSEGGPLSCLRRTHRGSRARGPGFTLAEVLVCLAVFAILAGALVLSWRGTAASWASPEKEAQSLARWISGLVTRSNYSGRPFELICLNNQTRDFIEAEWQIPLEKETYRSLYGCKFLRYQNSAVRSRYTPQWNSLLPAATIKVSREKAERERAEHFVIVSRQGRARTSTSPPP